MPNNHNLRAGSANDTMAQAFLRAAANAWDSGQRTQATIEAMVHAGEAAMHARSVDRHLRAQAGLRLAGLDKHLDLAAGAPA